MSAVPIDNRPRIDRVLLNIAIALLAIGLVMVFSASYARAMSGDGGNGYYFVKRQLFFAGVGLCGMLAVMRVRRKTLFDLAVPLLALAVGLLILCWVPGIGISERGAHRWIGYGQLRFQPAEFAKLAVVLYLAAMLSSMRKGIREPWRGFGVQALIVGFVCVLIEREPDMGTAAVVFLTAFSMLYLGGARPVHLAVAIGVSLLGAAGAVLMHPYRLQRILMFLNPHSDPLDGGYQIIHGVVGVGSGGVTGVGVGFGREKFYLPAANTDYVFATVAEEVGLLGGVLLIGLILWLGYRAYRIACEVNDDFLRLVAAGVTLTICWQALINMSVVTASIPATGVPLPFVSYGPNSLIMMLLGIGLLLNISQYRSPRDMRRARRR